MNPDLKINIFNKWNKMVKKYGSKSIIKKQNNTLFAENLDGLSVFMSRFLKPDGQFNLNYYLMSKIQVQNKKKLFFLALITFIEDKQTLDYEEEIPDCQCTDNEFISLSFGDYESYAVVLCNFFQL